MSCTSTEPLLSPTALMQLPPESLMLLIGTSPPALLNTARYVQNSQWLARSTMPPHGGTPYVMAFLISTR